MLFGGYTGISCNEHFPEEERSSPKTAAKGNGEERFLFSGVLGEYG